MPPSVGQRKLVAVLNQRNLSSMKQAPCSSERMDTRLYKCCQESAAIQRKRRQAPCRATATAEMQQVERAVQHAVH